MEGDLLFRVCFAGYYLCLYIIMRIFRKKTKTEGTERRRTSEANQTEGKQRWLRKLAGYFLMMMAALYVVYPNAIDFANWPIPDALRIAAVIITFSTLPLLVVVLRALGRFWSRQLNLQSQHELITTGPYAWVRHPLYVLVLVALLGVSFISANGLLIIPALLACTAIVARVNKEEAQLLSAFPNEYLAYQQRTGRFIPKWRGVHG